MISESPQHPPSAPIIAAAGFAAALEDLEDLEDLAGIRNNL